MASTTFTDGQSIIYSSWLNDVNNGVYNGNFPNGVLNPTTLNATNVVTTNLTVTNFTQTSINLPNSWSITTSASKLYFNYNGTNVASIDTSGNFVSLGNTTAGATP
jgi:hypothetical protein